MGKLYFLFNRKSFEGYRMGDHWFGVACLRHPEKTTKNYQADQKRPSAAFPSSFPVSSMGQACCSVRSSMPQSSGFLAPPQVAYSGAFRTPNPEQSGHLFHLIPDTHSSPFRTLYKV